jgi:hypothetical protein
MRDDSVSREEFYMLRVSFPVRTVSVALALALAAVAARSQTPQKTPQARKKPALARVQGTPAATPPVLEPRALELLKAMSAKLAAAHSLSFTALSTYESPSRYGAPLAFTTVADVLLQRPDKLRVITKGDGPVSEFYYDGKTMTQFAPAENLVAIADAPPTIDAMLKTLYDKAGTYFTFTDVVVADPYGDMAPGLKLAFSIGQSSVVGGTTTDMVAYEDEGVFVQLWIGAEDKLPRLSRAVFFDDPLQLRHQVELSHWQIDPPAAAEAFASTKAAGADHIQFAHPKTQSKLPEAPKPAGKPKRTAAAPKLTPKAQ